MGQDNYVVVRSNERVKLFSGIAANLSTALIAGTAYRVFVDERPDIVAVVWIVGATALIWMAHAVLGMMEPEI